MNITLTCKECGKTAQRTHDAQIDGMPVLEWWKTRYNLCSVCHDNPERVVPPDEFAARFNMTPIARPVIESAMIGRRCDYCHDQPADPRYREITGIEQIRDQGGANKIIARQETGRIPCAECVRKLKDGIPLDQRALL